MTKCNVAYNFRSPFLAMAFTLLASVSFYACKKVGDKSATEAAVEQPSSNDRLLSVANVYYEADGRTITVLFYETPLVHSISRASSKAEPFMRLLKEAKTKQQPVNVRVSKTQEDWIESILPATEAQLKDYEANKAQAEAAEQVDDPETMARNGASGRATLAAVIPNMTTLNTIFNTLRNQCCKLAGPYLYGQCIPFQYVADGCYARAHKMRQIIESFYGYTSYKAFNYADQCPLTPGVLAVSATLWGNNCCVRWWYHVAPYVFVQSGTSQVAYLLDPSMHATPVAIATWLNAQKNTGCGYTASTVHKQAYYTSSAYWPSGYNYSTCTINVAADNTYTAANNTCAAYAPRQGCL